MLSQGQTFSAEGLRKKSTTRARAHLAFNNDQQKRGSQGWQKVTLHWAFLSEILPTKPGHLQKRGNQKKHYGSVLKNHKGALQSHANLRSLGNSPSLGWHTSWPTTSLYQVHSSQNWYPILLKQVNGTWLAVVLQLLHRWVWGHQDQPGKKNIPWFRNSGDHHLWWCWTLVNNEMFTTNLNWWYSRISEPSTDFHHSKEGLNEGWYIWWGFDLKSSRTLLSLNDFFRRTHRIHVWDISLQTWRYITVYIPYVDPMGYWTWTFDFSFKHVLEAFIVRACWAYQDNSTAG